MKPLLLGTQTGGGSVELPVETLLRHMVCLGSSGSGKTVASKVVCEEVVRRGLPVVAVDPQGDIASLARLGDAQEIVAKGVPEEVRAQFAERAEVVVWTPGSDLGVPVSVDPLAETREVEGVSAEERLRRAAFAADALVDLAGYDLSSKPGRYAAAVVGLAIQHAGERGEGIESVSALIERLERLPDGLGEQVLAVIPETQLGELVRQLRLLTLGTNALLLGGGVPLDVDTLLGRGRSDGKARVSVVYLNSLGTERQRQFFVAQLAQALYRWMLANPSRDPQALFYVDEVAPYIPPVRKPVCKEALMLLLRQARKYGVCCLLATQSPGDLDYKSLSQIGTWALGRLMTRQERQKVEGVLRSLAPEVAEQVAESLPKLTPGQFKLLSPDVFDDPIPLQVRWLVTEHQTLDARGIAGATEAGVRASLETKATERAAAVAQTASGRAEVAVLTVDQDGQGGVNLCEVVVARGSGSVTALGGQSRVSKESIKVAWKAAAQLQSELELPRSVESRYDLTVLDTRLAVKKDGPSAGLAVLTGVVAALRGLAPRPDVAMTGEVTILGKVLAVGGIEEKVRAAYEAGYSAVVVPKENAGEARSLPRALRDEVEVVPVASVHEALPIIFGTPERVALEPRAPLLPASAPEEAPSGGGRSAPTVQDQVLEVLQREAQAFSYDDLAERVGASKSAVTSSVRKLEEAGAIKKVKRGRRVVCYHAEHPLRPEHGLVSEVEVVRLHVLEPEARATLERSAATSFLVFSRETLQSLRLRYVPLYQAHFAATRKEGWLFTREVERRDNLYFHAVTGALLLATKSGFAFTDDSPADPIAVVDLDDLGCLETRFPGTLELDEAALSAALSEEELSRQILRKFTLELLGVSPVFLPVWSAEMRDKNDGSLRDVAIDGFKGQPITLPR